MIAAGFGCRAGCHLDDLLAALAGALGGAGRALVEVRLLCAPDFKRAESALHSLAARLERRLVLLPMADLVAQDGATLSASEQALRHHGLRAVAESAALAGALALGANAQGPRLLGPRCAAGGATCALAVADGLP